MPFPKEGTAWPPDDYRPWYNKITEWATWYSGDPQALLNLYSSQQFFPDNEWGRFWARVEAEERSNCVHIPVAGDIASTSANLLFSEAPIINFDPKASGGARIGMFIKENGLLNLLLEAAETASAMSGVFLKLDIDPDLVGIPLLSIISPLQAIPYFRRGRLSEVLFFRTVKEAETQSSIWRLFELRRREGGKLLIDYKLYQGTSDRVGREVDMKSIDETANLGLEPVTYAMEGLACVYIPNMRPNRLMPGSPLGINDYSGAITLMDSLDFAWTSWMRDIEMGMAQVIVDEELLEKPQGGLVNQDTNKARFNKFQRAFIRLNMSPWRMGGENVKPIEPIQFEIRVDEHLKTCESLFLQIVSLCGYSPQTFGLVEYGRQTDSGTALRIRERKSLLTREKKSRYWQTALWDLFYQMQQLDIASNLSSSYQIQEVDIELQDSVVNDSREQSETLRNLDQAKAISIWQKVKALHPDWDDKDIDAEVKRILDDQGLSPMPFEEDFDRGIKKDKSEEDGEEEVEPEE